MQTINFEQGKSIFPSEIFVKFKNEFVHGGYFTALAGPAMASTGALLTNNHLAIPLLLITFIMPLMVYSFDYYKDMDGDKESNPERAATLNKKAKIYPYIIGSYIAILAGLLVIFANWELISFVLLLILLGALYPVGLKKITKVIPGFKNIYTMLVWSMMGAFSAALFNHQSINLAEILVLAFIFFKTLPDAIFFDLKDIENDRKEGLKTIPVLLGKKRTINFLYGFNILAFIPIFIGIYLNILPVYSALLLIFLLYGVCYLKKGSEINDNNDMIMFSYIIADGECLLWPFIILIGSIIL